jgi:hypothetical protein
LINAWRRRRRRMIGRWRNERKIIVILVRVASSIHLSHKCVNPVCHVSLKNVTFAFLQN